MDITNFLKQLLSDKESRSGDVKDSERELYELQRQLRGTHEADKQYPLSKNLYSYGPMRDEDHPKASEYEKRTKEYLKKTVTPPEDEKDIEVFTDAAGSTQLARTAKPKTFLDKYVKMQDQDYYRGKENREIYEQDYDAYLQKRLNDRQATQEKAAEAIIKEILKEKYEPKIQANSEYRQNLQSKLENMLGIKPVYTMRDDEKNAELNSAGYFQDRFIGLPGTTPTGTLLHELMHAKDHDELPNRWGSQETKIAPGADSYEQNVFLGSSGHHEKPGIAVFSEGMDQYKKALEEQGFEPFTDIEGEDSRFSEDVKSVIPQLKKLLKKEY